MYFSIIIPTLNEAKYIKSAIERIKENIFSSAYEIIVVDSGSKDETVSILKKESNVKLLLFNPTIKGRAEPLNYASKKAKGDVIIFLDADTFLPKNFDVYISKAIMKGYMGGAFEFTLNDTNFNFRIIELINRIRYRVRNRFYGDQGFFVTKAAFNKVGGFPEIKLLETAHLCANLQNIGDLILLKKEVKTSSRRFLEKGIYKTFSFDIKIWFLDLIGFDVNKYSEFYWK